MISRPTHLALFALILVVTPFAACAQSRPATEHAMTLTVTADRGRDLGQNFGSLFQARTADGNFVVGAGFPNAYNTRYRADRHAVELFVRPTRGARRFTHEPLPRPNDLCGTYLFARDGVVHSTYGGVKAWDRDAHAWKPAPEPGGTNETMRVGDGVLAFGDSTVTYNGQTILNAPDEGSYQLFYYANGHLCFYHVNRKGRGYRPYQSDDDGFSKLYACPWTPGDKAVDLGRAVVMTLPVVGETTFAWGQLRDQIVTGSNIGGFYVFADGQWRMLLEPELETSYQLYSSTNYRDVLLMGQYPTGRVFVYDGDTIRDQPGWPPKLEGVTGSVREAQTTVIYGGDVFVGVWPWGEVWRYNPDSQAWTFMDRMFDHPELSDRIAHPYDEENRGNAVSNQWGQRITSLVPAGGDLFVGTSAKWPCEWDPEKFPFLDGGLWKSYGTVHRLTMPGHLTATTQWTDRPTTFRFVITDRELAIYQDGEPIGAASLPADFGRVTDLQDIKWGNGIHGPFTGPSVRGQVVSE